jgi:hypothetical protein
VDRLPGEKLIRHRPAGMEPPAGPSSPRPVSFSTAPTWVVPEAEASAAGAGPVSAPLAGGDRQALAELGGFRRLLEELVRRGDSPSGSRP